MRCLQGASLSCETAGNTRLEIGKKLEDHACHRGRKERRSITILTPTSRKLLISSLFLSSLYKIIFRSSRTQLLLNHSSCAIGIGSQDFLKGISLIQNVLISKICFFSPWHSMYVPNFYGTVFKYIGDFFIYRLMFVHLYRRTNVCNFYQ